MFEGTPETWIDGQFYIFKLSHMSNCSCSSGVSEVQIISSDVARLEKEADHAHVCNS